MPSVAKKVTMNLMKASIIGLGQIGGSLAWGLKKRGFYVKGISRSPETVEKAKEMEIANFVSNNLEDVKGSDVIVICTHISAYRVIIEKLRYIEAIFTDVGSVQRPFHRVCSEFGIKEFVGGHPIAGTEKIGVLSANPNLFVGKICILTGRRFEEIEKMWESVGAKVIYMSPEEHDKALGYVSHLPHVIAFSVLRTVKDPKVAGGSFMDITRITESPVEMWTDILMENADFVSEIIDEFVENVRELQDALQDKDRLRILIEEAKRLRATRTR